MNVLRGYIRTFLQYLHTPKGRHDFRDYAGALLLIGATTALACTLLYVLSKEQQ